MFILDTYNNRVLKWQVNDPLGYIVAGGNGGGSALNQMSYAYRFFVDNSYNIYISENGNNRIVKWTFDNITSGVLVRFSFFILLTIYFI